MKKLIAIVGMSGSGKSVASDYLEEKGFEKIYFGGVVLEEIKKRGLEVNPENEKLNFEGMGYEVIDNEGIFIKTILEGED